MSSDLRRPELTARLLAIAEVAMVATLVLAVVVGLVDALAQGWTSVSDDALIELAVRDVPGHLPLTGVYSRYGWSHPGPMMFYLLALPYRMLGSNSVGLVVGSLAGQLGAALATWAVVRHLHRVTGVVVLCAMSAVLATTGAAVLRSPWNPHVALIGSGLLVALAWAAAARSKVGLLALWTVGSLLVQSHVVTAPFVVVTSLTAVALALAPGWFAGRPDWDPPRRTSAAVGVALAGLCWLPPLVQQLTGDPGNLGELFARRGTGATVGLGPAVGSVTQAFGALPSVLDPAQVTSAFASTALTVPWWLLVPIAGAAVAVRRGDRLHVTGLVVAAGALTGGLIGVAAISDALYAYLIMWNRSVVVMTVAIAVGALLAAAPDRTVRAAVVGLAAIAVAANVWICVAQIRAENPLAGYAATVDALAQAVEGADLRGTLAVDPAPDIQSAEVATGLMVQLERDGAEVTSTTLNAAHIGQHRKDRTADNLLLVAPVTEQARLEAEGWTVLTAYQPLDEGESTRAASLRRQLAELVAPRTDDERAEYFRRSSDLSKEIDEILDGRAPMLVATRPA